MTNLINKTTFKVITVSGNGTSRSCLQYAKISDELVKEIKLNFYDTEGTVLNEEGVEQPLTVDLNLVESLVIEEFPGVFDRVTSIVLKDKATEAALYEKNKTNNEFHNFKHRLFLFDESVFLSLGDPFQKIYLNLKSLANAKPPKAHFDTPHPVVMNEATQQIRIEQTCYVDYIDVAQKEFLLGLTTKADDGTTDVPLCLITPNPTKDA